MAASFPALLPALALSVSLAYAHPVDPAMHRGHRPQERTAAADVTAGATQYAELHRRIAASLPALSLTADAEQRARAQRALAAGIREARATAVMGDIFTARASVHLRRWIEVAVRERGGMTAMFGDEYATALPFATLNINQELPWGAGDLEFPITLTELPPLPDELAYRLWGRDLLLVDLEANLVVDVLVDALPAPDLTPSFDDMCEPEAAPPHVQGDPCDAHGELEMCWS
jgi:hypothetical protein